MVDYGDDSTKCLNANRTKQFIQTWNWQMYVGCAYCIEKPAFSQLWKLEVAMSIAPFHRAASYCAFGCPGPG